MTAITTTLPALAGDTPASPAAPVATAAPAMTTRRAAWLHASRRSIPAARTVAAIDVLVMTAALLAVGSGGVASWPRELGAVLSARVAIGDLLLVGGFAAAVIVLFEIAGLYEAALVRRGRHELQRVLGATGAVALLAAIVDAAGPAPVDWPVALQFWTLGACGVAVTRAIRSRVTKSAVGCRRALIVGTGPHALRICRELSADPLVSYQVVGFVDTADAARSAFVARRTLGTLEELERLLVREHVDEVHVGLPVRSHYHDIQDTIRVCERIGVKVMYGADIFGTELARPAIDTAGLSPRVELTVVAEGPAVRVKRVFDIVGATALIIILSPLLIAVALAVKLTSRGPVIFAQERYGLNRRRFRMFKFRTMVPNAEQLLAQLEAQNEKQGAMFKMTRDPRVTPIGRILRRTSIDELPQLFNVLRGDMSLVGPRPMSVRDVNLFTRAGDMRKFSVMPGLTGLWQVSGRTSLSFDDWIRLDLHYIDNWSLLLDFRILARTLPAVIRGTGAA